MAYATATKDQMKIWKSASRPIKDGNQEPPQTKVVLEVKTVESGMSASLVATSNYQMMRRFISVHDDYREGNPMVRLEIPRDVVASAEKLMAKRDIAYIYENKIMVMELKIDHDTQEEIEVPKATVPFILQATLASVWGDFLGRTHKAKDTTPSATVDVGDLVRVLAQIKPDGARRDYAKISIEKDILYISAYEGIEDLEVNASVTAVAS